MEAALFCLCSLRPSNDLRFFSYCLHAAICTNNFYCAQSQRNKIDKRALRGLRTSKYYAQSLPGDRQVSDFIIMMRNFLLNAIKN